MSPNEAPWPEPSQSSQPPADPRPEPPGPTILDRIAGIERELNRVKALANMGLLGTDQTIKGCHDRLDSLLGAGVAAPDGTLITNFNAGLLGGKTLAEVQGGVVGAEPETWLMSVDALLTQGSNLGGSDGPGVTKAHRVNLPDAASTAWAWNFVVPASLGGATATVTAYWTCSVNTNNLRVQYNYNAVAAGADAGAGVETAITETAAAAQTTLRAYVFGTNMTLGAAGSMQRISFRRLGTDGADTCTGELRLYGLLVKKA